ncbi:MAG: F0F1 ATP synthase subunit epsilon [Flavobacteriaceae bacterium]
MFLEIVSPEATLFSGTVSSVILPGTDGEFQILENHAAIVSTLTKGRVRIEGEGIAIDQEHEGKFLKEGSKFVLSINSGTIEMKDNKVIVLAD